MMIWTLLVLGAAEAWGAASESVDLPTDVRRAIVAEGYVCTPVRIRARAASPLETAWEMACREGGGLAINQAKAQRKLIWIQDCAQLAEPGCAMTPPQKIQQQILSIVSSAGIDCQKPKASFSGHEFNTDRVYYAMKCVSGRSYIVSGTRSGAQGRAMRLSGEEAP